MKRFIALILSVVVLGTVFYGCAKNEAETLSDETTSTQSDGVLSSFTTTDIEGNNVDETVFEGKKLTMVNIWATYCGPCKMEMPWLGELNHEYEEKGFQIIGIPVDVTDYYGNIDAGQISLAKEIITETQADYIHLLPSASLNQAKLSQVYSVPETIFVDEKGNQVGESYIGARSKEAWAEIIDGLLENM